VIGLPSAGVSAVTGASAPANALLTHTSTGPHRRAASSAAASSPSAPLASNATRSPAAANRLATARPTHKAGRLLAKTR